MRNSHYRKSLVDHLTETYDPRFEVRGNKASMDPMRSTLLHVGHQYHERTPITSSRPTRPIFTTPKRAPWIQLSASARTCESCTVQSASLHQPPKLQTVNSIRRRSALTFPPASIVSRFNHPSRGIPGFLQPVPVPARSSAKSQT